MGNLGGGIGNVGFKVTEVEPLTGILSMKIDKN